MQERLFWLEQRPCRHEPVGVKVVVEHDGVAPLVRGVLGVGGTGRSASTSGSAAAARRRALHSTYVILSHLKTVSVDKSALNSWHTAGAPALIIRPCTARECGVGGGVSPAASHCWSSE